jgi:hypothetical protein
MPSIVSPEGLPRQAAGVVCRPQVQVAKQARVMSAQPLLSDHAGAGIGEHPLPPIEKGQVALLGRQQYQQRRPLDIIDRPVTVGRNGFQSAATVLPPANLPLREVDELSAMLARDIGDVL